MVRAAILAWLLLLGPAWSAKQTYSQAVGQLVSSRLVPLGQYLRTTSNGTDTGSNSRIATWNESGATVNKIRIVFPNWQLIASSEADCPNAITITAAFEYPQGTFSQVTFSGGASLLFRVGNIVSDQVTLSTPWPSDAQAFVRTYVSVPSGSKWCVGYAQQTTFGEAVDSGTSTSDKTMSGTIANNAGVNGYGPAAVVGTSFTGAPRNFALAAIGDSETQGPGGYLDDRGNAWPWGSAAGYDNLAGVGKRVPFLNLAEQGTKIDQNLFGSAGAPLNYRMDLMLKVGVTHVALNWGTNDLNTDTPATIEANLTADAMAFAGAGFKVVTETIPPHTTSTDGWVTTANQTPFNPGYNGATPFYGVLNDWTRTTPAPFFDYSDNAAVVETSRNSAVWRIGGGTATTNVTGDGVHWTVQNLNPEFGGAFTVRDALIAKIATWCGC